MPKQRRSGLGGWLFPGIVLLGYELAFLPGPESAAEAFAFCRRVMGQVFPVLGLVVLLLFITNILLTPSMVKKRALKDG